ncbi:MAG: hypothetical protein ACKVQC_03540 [Elusimicrobiota bacterium]
MFQNTAWIEVAHQDPLLKDVHQARTKAIEESRRMHQDFESCLESSMGQAVYQIDLYEKPEKQSRSIGKIFIRVDKEQGLSYLFAPSDNVPPQSFALDDFDPDYGYGNLYHTALATKGDWVKLPKEPFVAPVWANIGEAFSQELKFRSLLDAGIVQLTMADTSGTSVVFTKVEGDRLHARSETPRDMDCEDQYSETQKKEMARSAKTFIFTLKELLDENGHLRIKTKYSRGC